jgi:hypothetical protein
MTIRALALFTMSAIALGCGSEPKKLSDPSDMSGTVSINGKPVKNVQLALRPKGEGHMAGCAIGEDGKFSVKGIPGEFMVYFAPLEDPKADKSKAKAGFDAIPTKYRDVSVDHTVTLKAGDGNTIDLK